MKNFFIKLALRFLPCAFDATNMNRIQGGTTTLWIYKTVEAVATGEVDAAFGWTSFKHLESDRLTVIELPPAQQVLRGTAVGMLSFAKDKEIARQFMDFLASPPSQAFYKEFGWCIPGE